jgi:uncharacterized cupredoxin-like copper-binding protein/mono/diheme cytochrome c family protein
VVKRGMIILAVGTLAVLGACGSQEKKAEPTVTRIPNAPNAPVVGSPTVPGAAQPTAAPTQAGQPAQTTFEVDLHDIFFDPKDLTIPANTDVTINLVNKGASAHTFDIDALNIHSGDVAPGATMAITINAAAGDYEYYCAIPGHKEAGMVGTLHVVEGGAATTAVASPVTAPPAATPAASPSAAAGGAQTGPVEVTLADIHFDPTELTIPANTDVTITLVNKGASVHNFNIDTLNIHSGDVEPGGSQTITINAPVGVYQYYCNIPGHKEAGMVGVLKVVAGGAPAAETPAPSAGASPGPSASPAASPGVSPAASPAVAITLPEGDVERGKSQAAVCLGCHSIDGSPSVGPTWKGLYGSQVELESGKTVTADEAYLYQSIKEPAAETVKGFPAGAMPAFPLTDQQIADLIAYIESLKD